MRADRFALAAPSGDVLSAGAAALLILAIALSFLPGQAGVPPIDRDEPRYTQATKQMMETGDYVRIRFQDAPRHKKPVGIHWLQAAAAKASGLGPDAPLWVYRLPSLLGALAALLLAVWTARAFLPPPLALTAAALFGATIILGVEARLAKTDAVLLATIVAAQGALARLWLADAPRLGAALVFWVALALGILVKGPIAPMVCGLTVAVLAVADRRRLFAKLRPLVGLAILAAVALPWYAAIFAATDGAFFESALGRDFLGKAAGGQEGHGAPPLTHLAFALAVGWPLAPFVVAAAARVRRATRRALLFCLAWAVPSWIVFELTPTKLPHYTLPLLPALAILSVAVLAAHEPPKIVRRAAALLLVFVPLAVLLAAPLLVRALGRIGGADAAPIPMAPIALAAALLIAALAAALVAAARLWRGASMVAPRVVAPAVASAVIAQAAVWGLALPALEPVWLSPRLVAAAQAASPCSKPRLASVGGYNEPSMIFLAGTDTALVSAQDAVALASTPCTVIAARERAADDVRAAAASAGIALRESGAVTGFNISKGDPVRLTLFVPD